MMRSDALALDKATIAGIHRSTAFDSRWCMNGGERGSEERRERGGVTSEITHPTLNLRS